MTYAPGQLVRIRARLRADRAGYVDHVTRTQVVLRTGERFSLRTGRLWGAGVSTTRTTDITIKGSWPRLHISWISSNGGHDMLVAHVKEYDGEGDTVIVSERDADEMRAVLAAQGAA